MVVTMIATLASGGGSEAVSAIARGDVAASGIGSNLYLFSMMSVFAVMLFAMILLVKGIQGRSWSQVVNGTSRVRWSRVAAGFALWGGISLLQLGIGLLTDPDGYEFRFDGMNFVWLLIISLVMIPLQTTAEEYAFRGYLAQGVGSLTHNRWAVLVIPSVAFGLMHGANPEVGEYSYGIMMPQYIWMGLFMGLMAILDDGIELSMGVHAANNIFASVFLTFDGSVLPTAALLKTKEVDPLAESVWLVVLSVVAIAILARCYKWDFGVLKRRIVMRGE